MADTEATTTQVYTKQVAGAEDLIFGFGSTAQIRNGENVTITLINADTIPFDNTRTVKQVIDELLISQASS